MHHTKNAKYQINKYELIYGVHTVLHALIAKRRRVYEVIIESSSTGQDPEEVVRLCKTNNIPLKRLSKKDFSQQLPATGTQGVAATVGPLSIYSLDRIRKLQPQTILAFDSLQDPQNIGALLRTAAALDVTTIIMPEKRQASLTGTVQKVAAGAVEYLDLIQVKNLARCLEDLKKEGYWIYGTVAEGGTLLWGARINKPTVIVLGNEGDGLRRLVRERCDELLQIPLSGPIESLNVSAAGAIVLSYLKHT